MPSITKEQALKRQSQAPDGWKYDWKYYVVWDENSLYRRIWTDETHFVEARVEFRQNYNYLPSYNGRSTCRVEAGHYHIALHVATWTVDANGTATSHGLGHWLNLDNGQYTRRNYKDICKIAADLTDEMILSYSNHCKNLALTAV